MRGSIAALQQALAFAAGLKVAGTACKQQAAQQVSEDWAGLWWLLHLSRQPDAQTPKPPSRARTAMKSERAEARQRGGSSKAGSVKPSPDLAAL